MKVGFFPEYYFKINLILLQIKFTVRNLKSNKKSLKKYIYIGTPEIFGSNIKPIKEEIQKDYKPSTPYVLLQNLQVELY